MNGKTPPPGTTHVDVAWASENVVPTTDRYTVTPKVIDGRLRLIASGPCPACGAPASAARDEVDLVSPIHGGGSPKAAAPSSLTARVVENTVDVLRRRRPAMPNKVQFVFECRCDFAHLNHPDEKNPKGCGRKWSFTAEREP